VIATVCNGFAVQLKELPVQARMQEMKLGVFFCKKWTFPPQNETKLNQTFLWDAGLIFYFTFYLFGGVCTHPTHPPVYGPAVGSLAFLDCCISLNRGCIFYGNSSCKYFY